MGCTLQPRMVHQVWWLRNTLKIKLQLLGKNPLLAPSPPPPHFKIIYYYFLSSLSYCFLFYYVFSSDKKATAKRQSLVNFTDLNQILGFLRFKIFLHNDGQLWVAHVILGFEPISTHFQISKHVIEAKDAHLARVNMAIEGFTSGDSCGRLV